MSSAGNPTKVEDFSKELKGGLFDSFYRVTELIHQAIGKIEARADARMNEDEVAAMRVRSSG